MGSTGDHSRGYGLLGLVVVSYLACGCHAKEHVLEHSIDGQFFSLAGYVEGDSLFEESGLVVTRTPLDEDMQQQLKHAIQQDGFYYLRIAGTPTVSSVRASCLAADVSQQKEEVQLQVDEDGEVVGMSYSLTSPACHGAPQGPPAQVQFPSSCHVAVQSPELGPAVVVSLGGSQSSFGSSGFKPSSSSPKSSRSSSGGEGSKEAAEGEKANEAPTPPVDERTWWQKNWLYCIAGGMMVMNFLTKLAAPAPPQGTAGAAGRPAGAPAAAARRN